MSFKLKMITKARFLKLVFTFTNFLLHLLINNTIQTSRVVPSKLTVVVRTRKSIRKSKKSSLSDFWISENNYTIVNVPHAHTRTHTHAHTHTQVHDNERTCQLGLECSASQGVPSSTSRFLVTNFLVLLATEWASEAGQSDSACLPKVCVCVYLIALVNNLES